MKISKQSAVAGVGGAVRWVEGLVRPGTRTDPATARSVLVLEFMLPLGSCVHMTPLYQALKRSKPELEITVATRGLGLQVLRRSPYVDHLIEAPDPLGDVRASATALARELKRRAIVPDGCVTGCPDPRTKIAMLAALACKGWRGGFTVHPQFYQYPLRFDPAQSQIENNLRVAALLGCESELLEPRVFYSAAEGAVARELLAPVWAAGKPVLVVVACNSGGQRTGWHNDRWVAALRHAQEHLGYGLVYVGTAADVAAIDTMQQQVGGFGISLAGKTNVSELAAVLALSDLAVSLDTGTMHVGRAVGVPMVVLGPSWQKPHEWLPLGKPHVRILRGEDRVGVPEGYLLDEISADAAIAAIDEWTQLYPAAEAVRQQRLDAGLSEIDLLQR